MPDKKVDEVLADVAKRVKASKRKGQNDRRDHRPDPSDPAAGATIVIPDAIPIIGGHVRDRWPNLAADMDKIEGHFREYQGLFVAAFTPEGVTRQATPRDPYATRPAFW